MTFVYVDELGKVFPNGTPTHTLALIKQKVSHKQENNFIHTNLTHQSKINYLTHFV